MAVSNGNDKIYLATKSAADDHRSRFSAQPSAQTGWISEGCDGAEPQDRIPVTVVWICIEIDSNWQESSNQQLMSFLFIAALQILTFVHGPSDGAWLCAEAAPNYWRLALQLIGMWLAYYCG